MIPTSEYLDWPDLDLLTGTIFGEASGENMSGRIAVGLVIRTRALNTAWWGRGWAEVILKPRQFSCWEDHNMRRIVQAKHDNDIAWQQCTHVAEDIYADRVVDTIGRPTHYHADDIRPRWAATLVRLSHIGRHIFYRDDYTLGLFKKRG